MGTVRVSRPAPSNSVVLVIDSLGTNTFEDETLRFLNSVSGAEHYAIYRMSGVQIDFLGGASLYGLHAVKARRSVCTDCGRSYLDFYSVRDAVGKNFSTVTVRSEPGAAVNDHALEAAFERFNIVDRVIMCGPRMGAQYAISALRTEKTGKFKAEEIARLSDAAELLVSSWVKHVSIYRSPPSTNPLGSLDLIESKIKSTKWGLTKREAEVSARILYGISAVGIALDLGLSEETVTTYRKRLYNRLRIGSRYELLHKYLSLHLAETVVGLAN